MNTIVFTICSNNYLAQAKTLMDSVRFHNSNYRLIIGLVDKLSPLIDYNIFVPVEIVPIEEIGIERLDEMLEKYDIVELNTSVKASYFKYLLGKYKDLEFLYYIDPDIKVYKSFVGLQKEFHDAAILLTPHIFTALPLDDKSPDEQTFLSHGIYNLGFIGIRRDSIQAMEFLDWWEERLLSLCFRNPHKGLFVDQLWVNMVPVFFTETKILREYGYNMAPWNLHERYITSESGGKSFLNDGSELTFYHFSSYDYKQPDRMNKPFYNRFELSRRQDLIPLYSAYHNEILENKVNIYSAINCFFFDHKLESIPDEIQRIPIFKRVIKQITPPFIYNILGYLKKKIYADI